MKTTVLALADSKISQNNMARIARKKKKDQRIKGHKQLIILHKCRKKHYKKY